VGLETPPPFLIGGKVARLVAPDKGVKETIISGKTYSPDRGGIYNVESARDRHLMKKEGYFDASLNSYTKGDIKRGFLCVQCGFDGWFRKCGRCGHESAEPAKDGE